MEGSYKHLFDAPGSTELASQQPERVRLKEKRRGRLTEVTLGDEENCKGRTEGDGFLYKGESMPQVCSTPQPCLCRSGPLRASDAGGGLFGVLGRNSRL